MLREGLSPRKYQEQIAEVASKVNTLVVLPTGLGKTMIAMLVASRILGEGARSKVVVLAPTRPLVLQHLNAFKAQLELPEGSFVLLTGTVDPGDREVAWLKARVVFATPQTVFNDVKHGRVSLREVALMVFDEAHRSVKDYTYTGLAQAYKESADRPLILGLTASPGATKEKVNEIKRNLFIEKVEARSEESDDVSEYVEETKMETVRVRVPEEYYEVTLRLRELFNEKVKRLLNGGFLRSNKVSKKALLEARATISARLKSAQASGGQRGYIFGAIMNQAQAVTILHAIEVVETQGASPLLKYLEKLRDRPDKGKSASSLIKDPKWLRIEDEALKISAVPHSKIPAMLSIVKTQFSKKEDSRVIVFTQYRDTIEDIVTALGEAGHTASRFVGQSDRTGSKGMDQETQSEALKSFERGEFKVLVSSSIGEEGLHVPDVDLVVFYEAVPSEIRYIQRRGRTGRTREGRVVILLAEGTIDESYYYSTLFKENRMRELVKHADEKPARRRTKAPTLMDFVPGEAA
ncbi:MAG: DEAD/DEAH box helicase [archaeon]|nr:MAG: DEAD/DEAH box helicase [archaeon]